jgi:hypothetical protein
MFYLFKIKMTKPQIKSFVPKNFIPPIQPQLNRSSSEKTLKDCLIRNSFQIKHFKEYPKQKVKTNQDLINDKHISKNNSSIIFHNKFNHETKIYFSRNLKQNNNHKQMKTSSQFDFKPNIQYNRNGFKKIILDKQQGKIDNLNNDSTYSEGFNNIMKHSPKVSNRAFFLVKNPKIKYITPISMNNSLHKDNSSNSMIAPKKTIQLNMSMENFSINISKINDKNNLISKAVSPISHNNCHCNKNNNISFDNVEGPEDMHFIFVSLFQKKKTFYEKLSLKINKTQKFSKIKRNELNIQIQNKQNEKNNSMKNINNDLFTFE